MDNYCVYCNPWKPSPIAADWGLRITLKNTKLECEYGSGTGPHGRDNKTTVSINYCPKCGRRIRG